MSEMKVRLQYLMVLIILVRASSCSHGPFVGRDSVIGLVDHAGDDLFESIATQISGDPYDPGFFAWQLQYLARGCLTMYNITGDRKWLDRALHLTDHFLTYSDVNRDGVPAWGNYNETWGNPRYDFREYTIWDGVIGLPMIETVKVIRSREELSSNASLSAKADAYLDLVTRIVHRHHKSWTQVDSDQGYYWDDPSDKDVPSKVNRFAALGRVELVLAQVTGNVSYIEKPRQMVNYIVANMVYNEAEDLYTWENLYGAGVPEDISHGAIELEFLVMASEAGLLDEVHLQRLSNTYLKRIWQVPHLLEGKHILAMRVDGTDPPEYDYAFRSRNWILLASFNPSIYDHQRTALGIVHEVSGMYPRGVRFLSLVQIPLMANRLRSMGIATDTIRAVEMDLLAGMLAQANDRLNRTMALGSLAVTAESSLEEASNYVNVESLENASVPIGLILGAWGMLGRIMETGELLKDLADQIKEAEAFGAKVSGPKVNLSILRADFEVAEEDSVLQDIEARIANLTIDVQVLVAESLIETAEEVINEAKNKGIDTSRHEIFLMRAKEEFDKGNYGPARQFTMYPLRLREELVDLDLLQVVSFTLVALGLLIRIRLLVVRGGSLSSPSPTRHHRYHPRHLTTSLNGR